MVAACLIGIGAGVLGLYLSYYAGVAAGASIAACVVAAYLAALSVAEARSLFNRLAVPEPGPEVAR
jgi:ABC-type Mn2+/Zn2+ transport system permease subunit